MAAGEDITVAHALLMHREQAPPETITQPEEYRDMLSGSRIAPKSLICPLSSEASGRAVSEQPLTSAPAPVSSQSGFKAGKATNRNNGEENPFLKFNAESFSGPDAGRCTAFHVATLAPIV